MLNPARLRPARERAAPRPTPPTHPENMRWTPAPLRVPTIQIRTRGALSGDQIRALVAAHTKGVLLEKGQPYGISADRYLVVGPMDIPASTFTEEIAVRRERSTISRYFEYDQLVHAEDFYIATIESPHLSGPHARPRRDPRADCDTPTGPGDTGVAYCDRWCRVCSSCSFWKTYNTCRYCSTEFDNDVGPPSPRGYITPLLPYETPLTAVAVAPFLALPLELQWQVILQGPLRPPSVTPGNLGVADTLTLYMTELTRAPRAAEAGGAAGPARLDYYPTHTLGHGRPAPPPGAPFLAAPTGSYPYYSYGAGPSGSGAPMMHGPMMSAHAAGMPWL